MIIINNFQYNSIGLGDNSWGLACGFVFYFVLSAGDFWFEGIGGGYEDLMSFVKII